VCAVSAASVFAFVDVECSGAQLQSILKAFGGGTKWKGKLFKVQKVKFDCVFFIFFS
jgi:hypothetical protein